MLKYLLQTSLLFFVLVAKAENETPRKSISLEPFTEYRYDVFQWSITDLFDYGTPRKKVSELTWKNYIFNNGIKIKTLEQDNNFNFLGKISYGLVLKGSSMQDSDWNYIGDEFSRSFSTVKGDVLDISSAIGTSRKFRTSLFTYYVGFDYSKYQFNDYGLRYQINEYHFGKVDNSIIVSKYRYKDYTPWIGASILIPINDNLSINPTAKFCLSYIYGEGDWLLRDDRRNGVDIIDRAFSKGGSFDIKLSYNRGEHLKINTNFGIKKISMVYGVKEIYRNNQEVLYPAYLKNLTHSSFYISFGVNCFF